MRGHLGVPSRRFGVILFDFISRMVDSWSLMFPRPRQSTRRERERAKKIRFSQTTETKLDNFALSCIHSTKASTAVFKKKKNFFLFQIDLTCCWLRFFVVFPVQFLPPIWSKHFQFQLIIAGRQSANKLNGFTSLFFHLSIMNSKGQSLPLSVQCTTKASRKEQIWTNGKLLPSNSIINRLDKICDETTGHKIRKCILEIVLVCVLYTHEHNWLWQLFSSISWFQSSSTTKAMLRLTKNGII